MPCAILRAFPLPHRFIVSFLRSPRRAAIIPHRLGIRPTFILSLSLSFPPFSPLRENPPLFETHRLIEITSREKCIAIARASFKITFVSKRMPCRYWFPRKWNEFYMPNLSRQKERKIFTIGECSFSRDIKRNRYKYIYNKIYIDKDLSESFTHVEGIIIDRWVNRICLESRRLKQRSTAVNRGK